MSEITALIALGIVAALALLALPIALVIGRYSRQRSDGARGSEPYVEGQIKSLFFGFGGILAVFVVLFVLFVWAVRTLSN